MIGEMRIPISDLRKSCLSCTVSETTCDFFSEYYC